MYSQSEGRRRESYNLGLSRGSPLQPAQTLKLFPEVLMVEPLWSIYTGLSCLTHLPFQPVDMLSRNTLYLSFSEVRDNLSCFIKCMDEGQAYGNKFSAVLRAVKS